MLGRYVPVKDNWAMCDSYCAHLKWMVRADKTALWAFLERRFDSEREFEVRFAVVLFKCMSVYMIEILKRTAGHRGCLHTSLSKKPQTILSSGYLSRLHLFVLQSSLPFLYSSIFYDVILK